MPPTAPSAPPRDSTTYFALRALSRAYRRQRRRAPPGTGDLLACCSSGGGGIDFSRAGFGAENLYQIAANGSLTLSTVRAQIAGPVLSTNVDQGSRVARGTPLARIDDVTFRDAFLSARGSFNTAKSNLSLAQRELDRFTKLKEAGAVSERDFETAKLNFEAAQSQVADAQARLSLAQKQRDDAQVRAPFAGIVSERHVNAGDVVSPGGAMFTIDPSSMRLEGVVPAHQLSTITGRSSGRRWAWR